MFSQSCIRWSSRGFSTAPMPYHAEFTAYVIPVRHSRFPLSSFFLTTSFIADSRPSGPLAKIHVPTSITALGRHSRLRDQSRHMAAYKAPLPSRPRVSFSFPIFIGIFLRSLNVSLLRFHPLARTVHLAAFDIDRIFPHPRQPDIRKSRTIFVVPGFSINLLYWIC